MDSVHPSFSLVDDQFFEMSNQLIMALSCLNATEKCCFSVCVYLVYLVLAFNVFIIDPVKSLNDHHWKCKIKIFYKIHGQYNNHYFIPLAFHITWCPPTQIEKPFCNLIFCNMIQSIQHSIYYCTYCVYALYTVVASTWHSWYSI